MAAPLTPYVLSRIAKDTLLRLPLARALNRGRAARRTGPTTELDYVSGILSGHLNRIGAHGGAVAGAHMLELGPGHTLAQAMVCRLLGATAVTAVDVEPHVALTHPVYRSVQEALPRWIGAGTFPSRAEGSQPELVSPGNTLRLDETLRYRIIDGEALPLPDDSIDLVYSTSVLEHVANVPSLLKELARVQKPGGLASHIIDLKDHIHPHPLDMLRYSDTLWYWMQGHSPGFINRLRVREYLTHLDAAGFEILDRVDRRYEGPLDPESLAPRFRKYSEDELRAVEVIVVTRRRA